MTHPRFIELRQRRADLLAEAETMFASVGGGDPTLAQEQRLEVIKAELKVVDKERWDLAETLQAAEAKVVTDAVASAVAGAEKRALDIVAACHLAERDDLALTLLRTDASAEDVIAELRASRGTDVVEINGRIVTDWDKAIRRSATHVN